MQNAPVQQQCQSVDGLGSLRMYPGMDQVVDQVAKAEQAVAPGGRDSQCLRQQVVVFTQEVVEKDRGQYDEPVPVFWATGACLLIRKNDYTSHGGLDGSFFAHMEEIDLCWRLNARGRKVMCVPSSAVYHVGGASLGKENPKKMYLNFRNNLLMLYKNVPRDRYLTTFAARCFFDFLAFGHLLLKRNFKSGQAVITAYIDFFKARSSYKKARQENLEKTRVQDVATWYKGSILSRFYTGKRTYSAIFGEGGVNSRKGVV